MAEMNRDQMLWLAGVIDAAHLFEVTRENGPREGDTYVAITLRVGPVSSSVSTRMVEFIGNGWTRNGRYFELGGKAAVRGLLSDLWGFLSPDTRSDANKALKLHKAKSGS